MVLKRRAEHDRGRRLDAFNWTSVVLKRFGYRFFPFSSTSSFNWTSVVLKREDHMWLLAALEALLIGPVWY